MIGLTGTPAPNSLMDLWAPVYLLDQGERLGKTITGFRDRYFIPAERDGHIVHKWRQKKEAEQRIYEA
ncbi:ATP-dependent helicase, partial [Acinetobacter baumannii]